jgi:hypothetical protein
MLYKWAAAMQPLEFGALLPQQHYDFGAALQAVHLVQVVYSCLSVGVHVQVSIDNHASEPVIFANLTNYHYASRITLIDTCHVLFQKDDKA